MNREEEDRVVWKEDNKGKRALLFVGDRLYHPFPFKDNLELMDSCVGGFFLLGRLAEE